METHGSTNTDWASHDWAINDDVVQLRRWATSSAFLLPDPPMNECTVGTAASCTLRLRDPSKRVSRLHAQLVRHKSKWLLRDNSKNGIRADGARRCEVILEPGIELGIGGIVLVAESNQSISLRNFVGRLLGWSSDAAESVDQAIRSIRMAVARRAALTLCGDGDLMPTARALHRRTRGAELPFIVCDPRRSRVGATVRSAENYKTSIEALKAAAGGSLCVRGQRLPPDFRQVMDALRAQDSQVQVIVCDQVLPDDDDRRVMPIVIPPLSTRRDEIDRIIEEYAGDAFRELQVPRTIFAATDHAWVRSYADSLPDIETATLRVIALRASRSMSTAAVRLGMAPVSLARWVERNKLPVDFAP